MNFVLLKVVELQSGLKAYFKKSSTQKSSLFPYDQKFKELFYAYFFLVNSFTEAINKLKETSYH